MTREAPRTLHSLSRSYQRDLMTTDYKVIAIDNCSSRPIEGDRLTDHGENSRYWYNNTESPSPVEAVNDGVRLAQGD